MKVKLKTVNIKGKEYVEVSTRVTYFNEAYPKGAITTEIITHQNGIILMKAIAIPDTEKPERAFTAYAQEEKGKGLVNALSYVENCETSAVGRVLGFMGIGSETSIATAEEVRNSNTTKATETDEIKEPEAKPKASGDQKEKPLQVRFKDAFDNLGEKKYKEILGKFGYKSASDIIEELTAKKVLLEMEVESITNEQ